jgi:hypothetical protein
MKNELTQLTNGMISEIGLLNGVRKETREQILNYLGMFGSEVDNLINKFYDINSNIANNGGAPVLKQIINKLYENSNLTIEVAKSTACVMLKDENNNLINHEFINKYYFDNFMNEEGLNKLITEFAAKNNVSNYTFGGAF